MSSRLERLFFLKYFISPVFVQTTEAMGRYSDGHFVLVIRASNGPKDKKEGDFARIKVKLRRAPAHSFPHTKLGKIAQTQPNEIIRNFQRRKMALKRKSGVTDEAFAVVSVKKPQKSWLQYLRYAFYKGNKVPHIKKVFHRLRNSAFGIRTAYTTKGKMYCALVALQENYRVSRKK